MLDAAMPESEGFSARPRQGINGTPLRSADRCQCVRIPHESLPWSFQGQTRISDIAEVVGPVDFHDIHRPPFAVGADLHQPYNPGHAFPQVKD